MERIKRAWRLFKNQFGLWRDLGVVNYWQEGNTIHVTVQRFGLFRTYSGSKFVCDIKIDPTKIQSE